MEWRPVRGYEGLYEVSETGDVRRIAPAANAKLSAPLNVNLRRGRPTVSLFKDGVKKAYFAHRIVCEAFHGPAPSPVHEVAHWDGNKRNNHFKNLRWATRQENEGDQRRHGTSVSYNGESHHQAKLTEAQVREIRTAYEAGNISQRELGEKYGVSQPNIGAIIRGERWSHVHEDATFRRLRVDQVEPDPRQPRKIFSQSELINLGNSILQVGLMQPITVNESSEGRHIIIAGERRWRAHKAVGLEWIMCKVVAHDDDLHQVEAIVENLHRVDLTPLEEAKAFQNMLDQGYTVDSLSEKLGLKQPWRISERTALLKLRTEYQELLAKHQLTPSQAQEMSRLSPPNQDRLFKLIKSGQCDSYNRLRAAANGLVDAEAQGAMFDMPKPTEDEIETVNRLERKIAEVCKILAGGFKENEVVIAKKVNPDRAGTIADELRFIQGHLAQLEKALRATAAQATLVA